MGAHRAKHRHGIRLLLHRLRGRSSLLAAIVDYRATLDSSDPKAPLAIKPEDARHNLELAKRLLVPDGNRGDSGPSQHATGSRPSAAQPGDSEFTPLRPVRVLCLSTANNALAGGHGATQEPMVRRCTYLSLNRD